MIFIIHGSDIFRRDLALGKLRAELVEPGLESMNYSSLERPNTASLISAISTPGFGGRRVTLVREMSQLESKLEDENELTLILEALTNMPEDSVLIVTNKKVLGTIKLVKELKKLSEVKFHEFNEFNDWEAGKAAEWILSLKEFKINKTTAQFFAEHIGCNDSSQLYSELQRLSTLSGNITEELIETECRARDDVFKLARELALGKRDSSVLELRKLINNDELHLGALAAISSSINRFLKLKLIETSPAHRGQEAQLLGISPGRLHFMRQEAAPMQVDKLEALSERLLSIERGVKTGKLKLETELRVLAATR